MWVVYKTTNNINGKYYVGVHDLESKKGYFYFGSGKTLKIAIKKYGRINFSREILCTFYDELKAYKYEKIIVNEALVKDKNCYNIVEGGRNTPTFYGKDNPFYGKKHAKEVIAKIRSANIGRDSWNIGIPHTKATKDKISNTKKGKKLGKSHLLGRSLSEEHKAKLRGNIPWNKGIKGAAPPYSTKCVVHGCTFKSIKEASVCFGVSRATIRRRCTTYKFSDCYIIKV